MRLKQRVQRATYFLILTSCAIFLGCEKDAFLNEYKKTQNNNVLSHSTPTNNFTTSSTKISALTPTQLAFKNAFSYQTNHLPRQSKIKAQGNLMKGNLTAYLNDMVSPPGDYCPDYSDDPEVRQRQIEDEKERDKELELEEELNFLKFEEITNAPLEGCGYKLRGFSNKDISNLCQGIASACESGTPTCHYSNCTTASYLAIIEQMKTRDDWPQKKSSFTCRPPSGFGKAYRTYTEADGLRKMTKKFGLGQSKRMSISKLPQLHEQGIPSIGDPLLLQRKSGSGHAVIFDKYTYDSNGKIEKVCYWSSNSRTKGSGKQCEKVSRMQFIDAAQIEKEVEIKDEN